MTQQQVQIQKTATTTRAKSARRATDRFAVDRTSPSGKTVYKN